MSDSQAQDYGVEELMWYQALVSGSIASGFVLVDFLLGLPSKPRSTRTQAAFHGPALPLVATRVLLVHTSRAKPCVHPHCTPKETEAPRGVKSVTQVSARVKSVTQVQFCPSPGSVSKKGYIVHPGVGRGLPNRRKEGSQCQHHRGL